MGARIAAEHYYFLSNLNVLGEEVFARGDPRTTSRKRVRSKIIRSCSRPVMRLPVAVQRKGNTVWTTATPIFWSTSNGLMSEARRAACQSRRIGDCWIPILMIAKFKPRDDGLADNCEGDQVQSWASDNANSLSIFPCITVVWIAVA